MSNHCKHPDCCQCGAKAGTPEHDAECLDAIICRALNKRTAGYVSRKLTKKPT